MSLFTMPLRLAYVGASTIEDASGNIVAECHDNETAAALVVIVNYAKEAVDYPDLVIVEQVRLSAVFERIKEAK